MFDQSASIKIDEMRRIEVDTYPEAKSRSCLGNIRFPKIFIRLPDKVFKIGCLLNGE